MEKSMSVVFSVTFMMLISSIHAQKTETNFFANHLVINGKTLIYEEFSVSSKGILTMVLDNPKAKGTEKVSFRIYLKRNNEILKIENSISEKEQSEIEISRILRFAILGDELIIEPTDKKYLVTKRVIVLKKVFLNYFVLNFLNKEGC